MPRKRRYEEIAGLVIDGLGLSDLMHETVLHHDDEVGNAHGLFLVVRDENGGDAGFALNAADLLPGLEAQPGIEVAQRFIQQQHPGRLDQGAGDGDALLLPAGELRGPAVEQHVDLHQAGRLFGAPAHFLLGGPGFPLQVLERKENILQDGHMRVQRIVLEHQTHTAVFGRKVGHVVLAEENPALRGRLQAADQVERGALSAAGRPEQADELPVGDFKSEIVDGDHVLALFAAAGKPLGQMIQYNFHGSIPFPIVRFKPIAGIKKTAFYHLPVGLP